MGPLSLAEPLKLAPMRARKLWAGSVEFARANPLLVVAIAVGLVIRIVYWVVTDRVLDDAYITIKHAKNVADGVGLTHHLGEGGPVHGFTSVLSVLVPLPGELIAGGGGIVALRLVSLLAFAATAYYAYRICADLELRAWATGLVLAYLALDQNQIFYGMAGMETQIATAVLLAGIYYVLRADATRGGIALGLALLARPDFVLWVAPAFIFILIRSRDEAARAFLWTMALVVPWVIFATVYYGSPVPNTIEAKQLAFSPDLPGATQIGDWATFVWDSLKAHQRDWTYIAPFLERSGPVSLPVPEVLLKLVAWSIGGLAIVGAVTGWRRAPGLRPAIVFVLAFMAYKVLLLTVGYFDWYGVPIIAVIVLLAAVGLDRLTLTAPRAAIAVPVLVLAFAYAAHIPMTIPQEWRIQHEIEDPVRDAAGRYLGEVTKPGDTIVAEPAGYLAFYTNATLLDYPGLTSTRVVDALRAHPEYGILPGMVALFEPDWIVMRPNELQLLRDWYPETAREYEVAREFSVSEADSSLDVWGYEQSNYDRDFIVLRRRDSN
jgi:hypothetical protein